MRKVSGIFDSDLFNSTVKIDIMISNTFDFSLSFSINDIDAMIDFF